MRSRHVATVIWDVRTCVHGRVPPRSAPARAHPTVPQRVHLARWLRRTHLTTAPRRGCGR